MQLLDGGRDRHRLVDVIEALQERGELIKTCDDIRLGYRSACGGFDHNIDWTDAREPFPDLFV